MRPWLAALKRFEEADTPCVMVTLLRSAGSAPREGGAKMVVSATESVGTLGGGTVELLAQQKARTLLDAADPAPHEEEFILNDAIDQACGGRMTVLFEPLYPPPLVIAIVGAGHVGQALVNVLGPVHCRVHWFDARASLFPDAMPGNARRHEFVEPASIMQVLPAGGALLAMSHSHDLDLQVVAAGLRRDDLALVGTIGSATKRGRMLHRLRDMGLEDAARQRLICPVGLPGVGGKAPADIAIAIAAQLLAMEQRA